MITVRQARLDDLPKLLEFEQGIIEWERPMDEDISTVDPLHYYNLKDYVLSDTVEVAVAEINGKLVGSGYAMIKDSKSYHVHDQHCYMGYMYTDPDHRGQGVNQKIVEYLKEWAWSKGLKDFFLTVYPDNPGAIKAYEKAGFTVRLLEMRLHAKK